MEPLATVEESKPGRFESGRGKEDERDDGAAVREEIGERKHEIGGEGRLARAEEMRAIQEKGQSAAAG